MKSNVVNVLCCILYNWKTQQLGKRVFKRGKKQEVRGNM